MFPTEGVICLYILGVSEEVPYLQKVHGWPGM